MSIKLSTNFYPFSSCRLGDATHLLPHLFQIPTSNHHAEGLSLQTEIADFETELQASIDEIWTKTSPLQADAESSSILQAATAMGMATDSMQEGWAKRMREYELSARSDPLDKVSKPDVGKIEWKERLARV